MTMNNKRKFKAGDKVCVLSTDQELATTDLHEGDYTEVVGYKADEGWWEYDDARVRPVIVRNSDDSGTCYFEESALELLDLKPAVDVLPIYTGEVPPIQEFNEAHDHQLRIALVGGLRSGKTTVARHLASTYGLTRVSFADKLKAESERMFGSITPLFDAIAPKPREVFVRYGQAMRSIYPDVFVAHARNAVNFALCNVTCPGVVIDDLRQPNEYEWLVDNGFIIIRITTDEETRVQRAASIGETVTAENLTDETESYIDKYFVDYDVRNNGTVEELYDTIDAIVEELRSLGDDDEDKCPCCGGSVKDWNVGGDYPYA